MKRAAPTMVVLTLVFVWNAEEPATKYPAQKRMNALVPTKQTTARLKEEKRKKIAWIPKLLRQALSQKNKCYRPGLESWKIRYQAGSDGGPGGLSCISTRRESQISGSSTNLQDKVLSEDAWRHGLTLPPAYNVKTKWSNPTMGLKTLGHKALAQAEPLTGQGDKAIVETMATTATMSTGEQQVETHRVSTFRPGLFWERDGWC
ncbi:hypothetical protein PISL3812_02909 [Talaromyces islandicus]|uniref:Uncharacterized protein n=1 Tax=Talaromyces islandicus TaxID=28573 RepID=A0A0U1LT02_TALIS|nr:hypothetical protein PISL3812_02909 [Talaromyces islandicus]